MKTLYNIFQKTKKILGGGHLLPVLILALITVAGVNLAMAQNHNLSDWNVPPPLPPGPLTKGSTTGKSSTYKPIVLTIRDIPAITPPTVTGGQQPDLDAISTTPPKVNAPDQPTIGGIDAGLPEIPLPAAPAAPAMPQQAVQDAPIPLVIDLPIPASPEMPAFPPEPIPSAQTSTEKRPIPLMPDVLSLPAVSLPQGGGITTWPTPGIPENISFKTTVPAEEKSGKGTQKGKSQSLKKSRLTHKPK